MSDYPVGIYLGPNDSSIAIWKNGKEEIITNYYSDERTTPSIVSFTKNERLVDIPAENNKS